MKRPHLAVLIYVVLTFVSGVLVGAVGHKLYTARTAAERSGPRSPEDYRRRYLEEMRSRLKLNDSQMTQLNSILDATRERWRQLREKDRPEMKAIQDEQVERILAILDEPQRAEYEKMRQERERHSQKSKKDDRRSH